MDQWLMVVIGWGIVGPALAIGASYALPWIAGNEPLRPGRRLSCSWHRP